jgi:hypothetical protein
VQSFSNYGILAWFNTMITDTTIRDCAFGISIDNAGAAVSSTIDHVLVVGASGTGVIANRNANVTVSNSVASYCGTGFAADHGALSIESCASSNNGTGILADNGGTAAVANTTTTGNATGWLIANVASAIQSWGNNRTRGNGTNVDGTATAIAMY